ncbi:hypothetical protein BV22DRAFT_883265 [Leucogyrophana mollusca]|uniref:Uncharacterized protein n=1 Tax=Leucogyrophana mollusca TaxID=85980 RepID=A0ACB8B0J8_9AGAM|nr:hypothetical protein BV22DRAFT_883265 [Leucogyrophana mollusca]
MKWDLHMCQGRVWKIWSATEPGQSDEARSEEEQSRMWRTARLALHLAARAVCCNENPDGTSWRKRPPSYGSHRSQPVIDGPDCAIRFLNDCYYVHDRQTVAAAFIILSQAQPITVRSPEFRNRGTPDFPRRRHTDLVIGLHCRPSLRCYDQPRPFRQYHRSGFPRQVRLRRARSPLSSNNTCAWP